MNDQLQPYPSIKEGFFLILLSLLITVFISLAHLVIFKVAGLSDSYKGLAYMIEYILAIGALILYANNRRKESGVTESLSFKSFSPLVLIVGLTVVVCIGILLEVFQYILPVPKSFMDIMAETFSNDTFSIIMAVVAAPVLEEILMRGILLDGFLKRYSPSKAIVWSAVIFGVFHPNPWQAVAGIAAGLILGWLYWQTKSLLLCILLHAGNNAIATIQPFLVDTETYPTLIHYLGMMNYIIVSIVAVMILMGCMRYLNRFFKRRKIIEPVLGELPM